MRERRTESFGIIQLSTDWQYGVRVWLQATADGRQLLASTPLSAPNGELRLRSPAVQTTYCPADSEGRYRWTRSADGMFLTLELIEDACPARSAVFTRTWVHALGPGNDGGPGVADGVTPMVQVTLPQGQRFAANGGEQWQEIKTLGGAQPFRALAVVRNPGGYAAPCSASVNKPTVGIAHTTDAFVAYVKTLPEASVTTSNTQVGGRPAVKLDVAIGAIDAAPNCLRDSIYAFHSEMATRTWSLGKNVVMSLYILQMDATTTFLLWYEGSAEEERAVLDSIQFIDTLPSHP